MWDSDIDAMSGVIQDIGNSFEYWCETIKTELFPYIVSGLALLVTLVGIWYGARIVIRAIWQFK